MILLRKDTFYSVLLVLLILFVSNFNVIGAGLLLILSMIILLYKIIKNYKINKYFYISLLLIIVSFLVTIYNNPINSSFYLLSELKILLLFIIYYFAIYVKLKSNDYNRLLLRISKVLIILSIVVPLYGLSVLHIYRYTSFLGLSIYMAYNIILFFWFFYENYSYKWKTLIFFSIFLLGSRTALFLYFLVVFFKQKNIKLKIFTILVSVFFLLYYFLIFRGMEHQSFENINRVLLIEATYSYMINHFTLLNYIFGYGIGKELTNYHTLSPAFDTWFLGSFTKNHVFSYAFHNEIFRLLYDFGILFFIFLFYFFKNYNFPIIILLFMMITNSIFFANGTILIIGLLLVYSKTKRMKIEQNNSFNINI
jgi:hypothetical protein